MFKSFVKITDKTFLMLLALMKNFIYGKGCGEINKLDKQIYLKEYQIPLNWLTNKHLWIFFTILQILATVPISSSSCERSISTLRNLKSYGPGKTKWTGIDAITREL